MAGLTGKQWEEVQAQFKEIGELRNDVTKMKVALIDGNGTKSLSQRVGILEKTPPKFSWKQVLANAVLFIAAVGLLGGFQFSSLDNVGKKIEQLENKVDGHIATAANKP